MRRVTTMLSAAAVVLVTAGLLAQAKPDFSGSWTLDVPAGQGEGAGGQRGGGRGRGGFGGWGASPKITQDATTLTVEYTQGQNPVKLTYKLDGSESHNTMSMRGQSMDQVSKASWDGDKLKIVTTTQMGDRTQTISLVNGKLTIETNAPGRDGSPMTTTSTYSKAS